MKIVKWLHCLAYLWIARSVRFVADVVTYVYYWVRLTHPVLLLIAAAVVIALSVWTDWYLPFLGYSWLLGYSAYLLSSYIRECFAVAIALTKMFAENPWRG